jgi:hypothetical protein
MHSQNYPFEAEPLVRVPPFRIDNLFCQTQEGSVFNELHTHHTTDFSHSGSSSADQRTTAHQAEFQALSEVPPVLEWYANLNKNTKGAYGAKAQGWLGHLNNSTTRLNMGGLKAQMCTPHKT